MEFNSNEFASGLANVEKASNLSSELYQVTKNMHSGFFDFDDFKYKGDINNIINEIFNISTNITSLSNRITNKLELITGDSSEKAKDMFMALHSNSDLNNQEYDYVLNYTDKQIARELDRDKKEVHKYDANDKNTKRYYMSDEALYVNFLLNNSDFAHMSEEDQISYIKLFREDVGEYNAMSTGEKIRWNTEVFLVSSGVSVLGGVEKVDDGTVTIASGALLYGTKTGQTLNLVSAIQTKFGVEKDDTISSKYKQVVEKIVDKDWKGGTYQAYVNARGVNGYVASGKAQTAGDIVGTAAFDISLQFLPGGNYVMMTTHGLKAAGDTAQKGFKDDKEYNKVFAASLANGGIEFGASGLLYGKWGNAQSSAVKETANVIYNKSNEMISSKTAETGFKTAFAYGKEYLKEIPNTILNEKYDVKAAHNRGVLSAGTTAFNEIFVSPAVNRAINRDAKISNNKTLSKIKSSQSAMTDANRTIKFYQKIDFDVDENKVVNDVLGTNDLNVNAANQLSLKEVKSTYGDIISKKVNTINDNRTFVDSTMKELNISEKLLYGDAAAKVAKKVSSSYIKEIKNNIEQK